MQLHFRLQGFGVQCFIQEQLDMGQGMGEPGVEPPTMGFVEINKQIKFRQTLGDTSLE